jgi:hypothetical protein|tara:strand:+ start:3508 stop:5019 length:1512 start_codon:yes stop_codon:yes gene_type:complete
MLQITEEQKLDIAETMSKYAGGTFYFLSDKIPAIKTSEDSKWKKIDSLEWWKVEALFPFKIDDVPSKLFSLDGAGKIKDFRKMASIIRKELNAEPSDTPIEKKLAAALVASKVTYLELQPLDELLSGAMKRAGRNPNAITENLLEIQRTPIYWMENHGRSAFKSNKDNFSLSDDGISEILNDPADIVMAARYFINETAYCENRFVKDFHELCGSRNLIPSVGNSTGNLGELNSDVKSALAAAYALGNGGDERNMIKAIMSLIYKHEPLGVARSKVPAAVHIKNIKELLSKKDKETTQKIENKPDRTSSFNLVELINLREEVLNLHNAINQVTSSSDDPAWVSITWSRFFSDRSISTWDESDVGELKNRLSNAKETYYPYLKAKVNALKESIGLRVPNAEITSDVVLDSLRDVWKGMNASLRLHERDPIKKLSICNDFSDILSESKLKKLSGDFPDMDCLQEIKDMYLEVEKENSMKNDDLKPFEGIEHAPKPVQEIASRPKFN